MPTSSVSACQATATWIRIEDDYGINLIPLATLALHTYRDDPCSCFKISYRTDQSDVRNMELDRLMHKAITVIQFKLEGQIIKARPEFGMESRLLLDKIDYETQTITIEGKQYKLDDCHFPTRGSRRIPMRCHRRKPG